MKTALILAAATIAGSISPRFADEPAVDRLVGSWEGFLAPAPNVEIRVILTIARAEGGVLKGRAETPDLEVSPPIDFESAPGPATADAVVIASKPPGREFRGKVDPDGRRIVGEWRRGAQAIPLTLTKLDGPAAPSETWAGEIATPAAPIPVVFHIGRLKDGGYRGTMDSPGQGAYGLKIDSIARDENSLEIAVKSIAGEFSGKLDPSGRIAHGEWKQGAMKVALTLKKDAETPKARRTQAPKPPFPYRSEEVAYDSKAPGVRIAGTLTLPPGAGPFPAVLLISGSGPQDRDETILGHKPFLVLADDLTRSGIAVLRVDDRGIGQSTGDFKPATTFDFADDAEAGFAYLRARKEIAPGRVGLIGHSEGGLIAPIVASRNPDVAFLVLLAGPGLPGGEILVAQQALILKASGVPEDKVNEVSEAMGRMVAIVREAPNREQAEARLKALRVEATAKLPEADRKALAESDPEAAAISGLATPWMRAFLLHDPRPTLARVRCPVLALNGELDLQVPCRDNLDAIAAALASGGNTRSTVRALPGLNHLFQPAKTGAPAEYARIEETFAPLALKLIGDWIIERGEGR